MMFQHSVGQHLHRLTTFYLCGEKQQPVYEVLRQCNNTLVCVSPPPRSPSSPPPLFLIPSPSPSIHPLPPPLPPLPRHQLPFPLGGRVISVEEPEV